MQLCRTSGNREAEGRFRCSTDGERGEMDGQGDAMGLCIPSGFPEDDDEFDVCTEEQFQAMLANQSN